MTKIRLWFICETPAARSYWKTPPGRSRVSGQDNVWIPKSIIEHTSKDGEQHVITIPDWFVEREKL